MQDAITEYRYYLPKKSVKLNCPDCGDKHRKTLSRYIDSKTDKPLPEEFGRCDRESNCGYHLSPYHKGPSGVSYADKHKEKIFIPHDFFSLAAKSKRNATNQESAVKKLLLAGATYEQAEYVVDYIFKKQSINSYHSKAYYPPKSVYTIPDEVFTRSLGHYNQNQFACLLRDQIGLSAADELLKRFHIGTSNRWLGACVFWLIDEKGRKRGAQIKLFGSDWHTVKYEQGDKKKPCISWVHTALKYSLQQSGKPIPDWLTAYCQEAKSSPCLFGLPQLPSEPIDKPIAIVEAPKTAILCTHYNKKFIWLATVGRSYLTEERLAPLKGRNIVLFPDLSVNGNDYTYWKSKADRFQQQGFNVIVSDQLERLATNEQRTNGFDIADYLLMSAQQVGTNLSG